MIGKNSKEQCSGETVRGRWGGLGTGDSKTSSAANPKSICQCRIGEWLLKSEEEFVDIELQEVRESRLWFRMDLLESLLHTPWLCPLEEALDPEF
jgi:hypothetical protein